MKAKEKFYLVVVIFIISSLFFPITQYLRYTTDKIFDMKNVRIQVDGGWYFLSHDDYGQEFDGYENGCTSYYNDEEYTNSNYCIINFEDIKKDGHITIGVFVYNSFEELNAVMNDKTVLLNTSKNTEYKGWFWEKDYIIKDYGFYIEYQDIIFNKINKIIFNSGENIYEYNILFMK